MYGNLFDYPELRKRLRNAWNEAGVRSCLVGAGPADGWRLALSCGQRMSPWRKHS